MLDVQLPVTLSPEPAPPGWAGVRHELWRASRVKLFVLFVLLCWSIGAAVGGGGLARSDAGDLSVVPGQAPFGTLHAPGQTCGGVPRAPTGPSGSCR